MTDPEDLGQLVDVAEDQREQVVEVVRHPVGELPHHLDLRYFAEPLLGSARHLQRPLQRLVGPLLAGAQLQLDLLLREISRGREAVVCAICN